MINVAFVCLGNICRSPMAELIFKNMIKERGLSSSFCVTSFGTSDCEQGNPIYLPAKKTLIMHGIAGNHTAKQISLSDIKNNDFILCMDSGNYRDLVRLAGESNSAKVFKLCSFTSCPRDVADPWYTRDFERAFSDITDGCAAFLEFVLSDRADMINYDKRH